ncbi:hypothetical protein B9Z55_024167 [Caenorhabditis nigoni]|nr:hypothetical protein B9Z55_024167 [Caenorhabditis nigoni]
MISTASEGTTEVRAQNVDRQHDSTFHNLQKYQQQHPHGTEAGNLQLFLMQQALAIQPSMVNNLPAVLAASQRRALISVAAPSTGIKRQSEAENAELANKKKRADASQHESDTNDEESGDDESDDDGANDVGSADGRVNDSGANNDGEGGNGEGYEGEAGSGEGGDGVAGNGLTDDGAGDDGDSNDEAAHENLLPDVSFVPSKKLYFNAPYSNKHDFIWVENESDITVKFKAQMISSNDKELPRLSDHAGYIPAKTALRLEVSCPEGTKSSDDRVVVLEIMNCSSDEEMMDREGLYQNWSLNEGIMLRKRLIVYKQLLSIFSSLFALHKNRMSEEDADVVQVRPCEDVVVPRRNVRPDHDISFARKIAYGVGHFYNDLCASMWFTYLMIYMEKVLKIQSSRAGMLMLIGQVTDAISTPLVGIFSDSSILPACFDKIGRRISWHLIGTILVSISFPMIFNKCFLCKSDTSEWYEMLWFVPFIMVFQFGWASVQISHLALIPELSSVPSSRSTMNSLRYAFTVIANLSVYFVLAWLLSESTGHSGIGPWDLGHFRLSGWLVVILGITVSFVFYAFTREPTNQRRISRLNSFSSDASELARMHWTSWFGYVQFYQIALLYMLSRLYINISQVYFPFYITMTQNYEKKYVAILPMVSYLSSFSVSMINSTPLVSKLSKKVLYSFGLVAGLMSCATMLLDLPGWRIYGLAVGIGIAQAILLITSLSITADLINKNTESGAFVYGAMSFFDKLSNGIAYQIIQLWAPADDALKPHQASAIFYRRVMVFVPGTCLVLAFLVLLSLAPFKIGERRRARPVRDDEQAILDDQDDLYPEISA